MDLELDGKVALITGSSAGIGLAIAEGLAAEGASVVLNGRDTNRLTQAARHFDDVTTLVGDVRDPKDCTRLVKQTLANHGRLDVLVCNVGSGSSVPPGQETPDEWRRVLDINLHSATQSVWAATEALAASGGSVVCVSSICGREALGCPVAYAAAKSALESYVRNAARPLAKHGVRINAVSPGNILFPGSVWERKLAEDPDAVDVMLQREVALARLGEPREIADLVAFLASPRSAFCTGASYIIDGGQTRS